MIKSNFFVNRNFEMGFFLKVNDVFYKLGKLKKTEVMFSLCIRKAITRTLFSFAIDCCLQTFTFLVYYKDLQILFIPVSCKIVLTLCLIFCLILQFLAKYLGNFNKIFLSKIIFVHFFFYYNS